jgi:hypothetical protein
MLKNDLFGKKDDELQKIMSERGHIDDNYKACFDILLLRRNERLVDKTAELVKETKSLAKTTWWVVIATWAVAGVTIIAILAKR